MSNGNPWDLYEKDRDFATATAALDAAWEQAKRLMPEASSGVRAHAAEKLMARVLNQWRRVGADDTEPRSLVRQRVVKHFGVEGGYL